MEYSLKWIFRALFYDDNPKDPAKEEAVVESIAPDNYGAVIDPWAENARLRRALDLLGVPAQALKDPDKAPPLRIDVRRARDAMEVVDG